VVMLEKLYLKAFETRENFLNTLKPPLPGFLFVSGPAKMY